MGCSPKSTVPLQHQEWARVEAPLIVREPLSGSLLAGVVHT